MYGTPPFVLSLSKDSATQTVGALGQSLAGVVQRLHHSYYRKISANRIAT